MISTLVDNVFTLESYSATLQNSHEELDKDLDNLFETPTKAPTSS